MLVTAKDCCCIWVAVIKVGYAGFNLGYFAIREQTKYQDGRFVWAQLETWMDVFPLEGKQRESSKASKLFVLCVFVLKTINERNAG